MMFVVGKLKHMPHVTVTRLFTSCDKLGGPVYEVVSTGLVQ